MVSKGLTGAIWIVIPGRREAAEAGVSPHPPSYPAQAGYPVRRGLSALSLASLEYRIARSSRATTAVDIPAARFARALPIVSPKQEGAGNAGCLLHPRSRVQEMVVEAHTSIQVQSEHSGIPCAMVLRLMPRSPRRRIPLASVADGLAIDRSPVGPDKSPSA
jgi:hypothetical protein